MKPQISQVKAVYFQDADGDDLRQTGEMQELIVEMTQCGAEPYIVLQTERWAIDEEKELTDLLLEFDRQVAPLFARNEE